MIYVLTGALRMEFGPDGSQTLEAGPGDFVYVPKGAVHREGNPTSEAADIIVMRTGSGQPTFNLDGPAGRCGRCPVDGSILPAERPYARPVSPATGCRVSPMSGLVRGHEERAFKIML